MGGLVNYKYEHVTRNAEVLISTAYYNATCKHMYSHRSWRKLMLNYWSIADNAIGYFTHYPPDET